MCTRIWWVRPVSRRQSTRAASGFSRGLFESWSRNWRGDDFERERSLRNLKRIAPALLLLYAFGFSIIAFERPMALIG